MLSKQFSSTIPLAFQSFLVETFNNRSMLVVKSSSVSSLSSSLCSVDFKRFGKLVEINSRKKSLKYNVVVFFFQGVERCSRVLR